MSKKLSLPIDSIQISALRKYNREKPNKKEKRERKRLKRRYEIIITQLSKKGFYEYLEHSKTYLLSLKDNFDEDGNIHIDPSTFNKIKGWLKELYSLMNIVIRTTIDQPYITAGSQGNIYVHWKNNSFELLVNFPASNDEQVTYYGDDYKDNKRKGSFKPEEVVEGLFDCLMSLLLIGQLKEYRMRIGI